MPLLPARRRLPALLATALVGLVGATATACGGSAGADGGGEVTTIRYQSGAGSLDPLELADALGYLDGLTLDKVGDVQGGPESLQALATGQIDISASAFYGATAKLVASGVPIKAVVSTYGSNDEVSASVVTLEDSGVREAEDLVGRKVAVNTLGANAEAVLDTYLQSEGLSQDQIDQVTLVPLPALNSEAALREGQVDAAYMSRGALDNAKKNGGIRVLAEDVDFVGPYNGGGFHLTERFIQQNPTTTRTLVAGVARANEYIATHSREEVLDVIGEYQTKHGREDYLEPLQIWPGTNGVATEGGVIRDQDVTIWLDWLESEGEVDTGDITPEDVFTNEFNPYADGAGTDPGTGTGTEEDQ
ncbi:ABC transporter substrate-binding protein [Nocardioides sp. NPDC092400]|uniref:ABC transporter substrate-binding protein n=1 Tax=Nocardioides sp. NPDC092400 TaxID=3155196 RepID=UPI0034230DA7